MLNVIHWHLALILNKSIYQVSIFTIYIKLIISENKYHKILEVRISSHKLE